jgi:AbiV family abortive infection protein
MIKADLKKMNEKDLSIGAIHSLINSFFLFHDAMLLGGLGRYSRAYTLVQLSIEEAGKSLMLHELAFFQEHENIFPKIANETYDEKLDRVERLFFDHSGKSKESLKFMISMIKNMFLESERETNEIKWIEDAMKPRDINNMKNLSLYVDVSSGSFEIPYDTITEEKFSKLQSIGHSILIHSKKYIFNNDELLKEMGANAELIKKLDPYSESRRLIQSLDRNKYYSKSMVEW